MGKSVKLSDGSYLDTEGIYDFDLGMTQNDINNGILHIYDLSTTEWGTIFNSTAGKVYAYQCGRIVVIMIQNLAYKSRDTSLSGQICEVPLSTLGLPKNKFFVTAPCIWTWAAVGDILIWDSDSICIRSSGATGTLCGQIVYIAED